MALKTNRTPFSDLARLWPDVSEYDADGYRLPPEKKPEPVEVFCSFSIGASRTEFYEAAKAGYRIAATVEVWEDDYSGEPHVSILDTRYIVRRVWPTGTGTLLLYLEEVMR